MDGDHYVESTLLRLLPVKAPLRSRQRQDKADHGQDQTADADLLSRGGDADGQGRQKPRLDELGQQSLPRAPGPPKEGQQRWWNRQQEPEHVGIGKVNGRDRKSTR